MDNPGDELNTFLLRNNLLQRGDKAIWIPLAGGVSSDIWRVDLPGRTICVKRALARLKVEAEWHAPVERNNSEWEWFRFVHRHFPGLVPRPIAHDPQMQMLAMEYLPPENFPVWKADLLRGVADPDFAGQVGSSLAKIQAKSAFDPLVAATFLTGELFYALRIEPYLLTAAKKHPECASRITRIAEKTLSAGTALVHGDVSPKNILVAPNGPVFLDAETAWYGDPAFDAAFCLNHFLLKSAYRPASTQDYLTCYKSFAENYLREVVWESRDDLEVRIARLLPVLFLARIDGKSPVDYISDETTKNVIRETARQLILSPVERLSDIARRWESSSN